MMAKLLMVCVCAALISGCQSVTVSEVDTCEQSEISGVIAEHPDSFVRIGESYRLSAMEMEKLRLASMDEDGADAAWTLRQHYSLYAKDKRLANIWRKRAAELGHEEARRLIDEERYKLTWEENMAIYPDIYGGVPAYPDGSSAQTNPFAEVE